MPSSGQKKGSCGHMIFLIPTKNVHVVVKKAWDPTPVCQVRTTVLLSSINPWSDSKLSVLAYKNRKR